MKIVKITCKGCGRCSIVEADGTDVVVYSREDITRVEPDMLVPVVRKEKRGRKKLTGGGKREKPAEGKKTRRTCSMCGEVGHTKPTCTLTGPGLDGDQRIRVKELRGEGMKTPEIAEALGVSVEVIERV